MRLVGTAQAEGGQILFEQMYLGDEGLESLTNAGPKSVLFGCPEYDVLNVLIAQIMLLSGW